jgi:hypothetical protein
MTIAAGFSRFCFHECGPGLPSIGMSELKDLCHASAIPGTRATAGESFCKYLLLMAEWTAGWS